MKPPTFFLSSTIYDFKDLRSAIKYHLEHLGCRVLASEFNDFQKPFDTHSYEACLKSISNADWFILLIGSRVGGWYDESNRVIITQAEYREAYRLSQSGKIKILAFVRADIWTVREDRKALAKHLEDTQIDQATKAAIRNHPSKYIADADFINAFISEVGRVDAIKKAHKAGNLRPPGNWIHQFDTFSDIVDVLNLLTIASRPIEETTLIYLLRAEMREILRLALVRNKEDSYSPHAIIDKFHSVNKLAKADANKKEIYVETKSFTSLCWMSLHILTAKFHSQILDRAIESSVFLQIDANTNTIIEHPVYKHLVMLSGFLRSFAKANQATDAFAVVFDNTPRARPHRPNKLNVKTLDLVKLLHLMNLWYNITSLAKVIILHLDGHTNRQPHLRSMVLIPEEEQNFANEKVTDRQVDKYINEAG